MSAIARLKIVLKDVEPFVMRQVEVPLNLKLDRLHTVIQTAMGWSDSHLYEFRFAGDVAFGIPDPDHLSNTIDARREPLRGALEDWGGKTFHYYYDFGDYWHHVIKIEKVVPALSNFDYPFFLPGTGRCPGITAPSLGKRRRGETVRFARKTGPLRRRVSRLIVPASS